MNSGPDAEAVRRSESGMRSLAGSGFDGLLVILLLWVCFSPPWHIFATWARIPELAELVELRRGSAVLLQVQHPFAPVADPIHRSIEWRLLFPVLAHALHLPAAAVLFLPYAGAWLAITAILLLLQHAGMTRGRAVAGAIILAAGGWFFVSTGWLGYFDSWIVLALLITAYARASGTAWVACALAPWIDERFLFGLPIALGLRLSRTQNQQPEAAREYYRLVSGGAVFALIFILARTVGRTGTAGFTEYLAQQQTFHTPLSRHLLGLWESLRIAWVPVAWGLVTTVRRLSSKLGGVFAAGVVLTMAASQLVANDLSRGMTILLPLGVEGIIALAANTSRFGVGLVIGAVLAVLLPARQVVTDFTMRIPRASEVLNAYRHGTGALDAITWVDAAVRLITQGRRAEAERYVDVALKLDPRCAPAYNARGFLATDAEQWRPAFDNFVLACRFAPTEPSYWLHQAFAAWKVGDRAAYGEAIMNAKRLAAPQSDVAARVSALERQVTEH